MAITSNDFFNYDETRALSGYKSAWLYRPAGTQLYSILALTESVPYVFGDKDSFEFDILQSSGKGQVEGKPSLEAVDVEVLHHRDNAYRFEKLKGQTIDFMCINGEFVGYKFAGTIDYRPNTAEADVNRATVTITPMSAQATPVFNARSMIQDTLRFATIVPENAKVGEKINLSAKQSGVVADIAAVKIASETNEESSLELQDWSYSDLTEVTVNAEGLYAFTISATGYAPWTTTVYFAE